MGREQWYLIENEEGYLKALSRYKEIKESPNGSDDHREKLLLVHLISQYEEKTSTLPDVDPIELIKIRMEDFGYNSSDLAKKYGDKGTVSKVLNYKQSLSLTMIRKFSHFLKIPVKELMKEYHLKGLDNNV